MGCHTWFKIPFLKGKEKIIELAQKKLDGWDFLTASERKWYQLAIDNEFIDPVCDIASDSGYHIDWCLYETIEERAVRLYNEANNADFYSIYELSQEERQNIETYSDEPRIGGYPSTVIRSYAEMERALETGLINDEGKLFHFYYEEERKPLFMAGIKTFFDKHPDGIITFG